VLCQYIALTVDLVQRGGKPWRNEEGREPLERRLNIAAHQHLEEEVGVDLVHGNV
jgi:hypothetical protein